MMILFRYITREVYATTIATTLLLLGIFICNQFIQFLGRAAGGLIPIKTVMQLMSLQVPLLLGYLLPLALFVSIFLIYGKLYADSEMTALASCGYSKVQLMFTTIGFSTVIAVLVACLMAWVEPKLSWYREYVLAEAAAASPIETLFPQRFQTLHGKWIVYVGDIARDHTVLNDLFVAEMPDDPSDAFTARWMIISAAEGHEWIEPQTQDRYMMLTDGYRYVGTPGKNDFQIAKYEKYGIRIEEPKFRVKKDVEYLPTLQLWKMRHINRDAAAELQWRFAMPISVFLLALIAFSLSRVRPRTGRYAKLAPGILIYTVYADLIFVIEAAIRRGSIAPFPGLFWVHGGILLLGIALLIYFLKRN